MSSSTYTVETKINYHFLDGNNTVLWDVQTMPNLDVSQAGNWTDGGTGTLPFAQFISDILPGLTGTGMTMHLDEATQTYYSAGDLLKIAAYVQDNDCTYNEVSYDVDEIYIQ